jgi:transposase-like protein
MALRNEIIPREKGAAMSSVLRAVKKRKKCRCLGEVEVVSREAYADGDLDAKVEMIRTLVPLGLMHVKELLDQEVTALAGERYARKAAATGGRRHGSNPGTVGLAGQRVPIRVPRVRNGSGSEIPLRSYEALSGDREVNDLLLKRVLYGISCRNYEAAAEAIPGAIGLSSSTVSRGFIEVSGAKLRELQDRDLSGEDLVAIFLDGKTFADATMVVALGITLSGEKRFLGFVETDTENEKVLTPFLRSLIERGLDIDKGLLAILDGGKGLGAAVRKAFRGRVVVQRCQWHKRENVVSYLSKGEQAEWRRRLQRAYDRPEHQEALEALKKLGAELEDRNQSAAGSLREGLEETLTLQRLGLYGVLGRSLKTTNCLESVNALIEERCAKVDHWKSSNQRQRWLATALMDIEPRLRKVRGYRHLPKLREALQRELKLDSKASKRKAA